MVSATKIIKRFKRTLRVSRVKVKWFFKRNFKTRRQRITAASMALVLTAAIAAPVYTVLNQSERYNISDSLRMLLSEPASGHASKLTYNSKQKAFIFNDRAIISMDGDPIDQLQSKVGNPGEDGDLLYGAMIPKDSRKGASFYDTQLQINFSMIPQFKTGAGKKDDGHVLFPLKGHKEGYLAYTLKSNGVKEDIILSEATEDELSFSYRLDLPDSLQARLMDNGSLGVYSVDPALLGSIEFGADDDRDKIEAARKGGEKTHLAFIIPKPVIYETIDGVVTESSSAAAYFSYSDNILTVHSRQLLKASYPLSIDPSVVVTSTEDFRQGNDEGGIDYDSGSISRGQVTGGGIGGWTSTTNLPAGRYRHGSVAYNGHLYIIGGADQSDTPHSNTYYAPILSNGTIGSWSSTSALNTPRAVNGAVVYNGYIYVAGGSSTSFSPLSSVEYARVNTDGSLGEWQTTTALPTIADTSSLVAYGGYLYLMGGDMGWPHNDSNLVYVSQINPDGTIGTWSSTSSFSNGRRSPIAVAYNDYMYIAGGYSNSGNNHFSDVQFARINSDGSLGVWEETTSFIGARSGHRAAVHKGYIYLFGGDNGNANTTSYAPILGNGTIGNWSTGTSISAWTQDQGVAVYNDRIYLTGNYNSSANTVAQFTSVSRAGTLSDSGWSNATSLPAAYSYGTTKAYNGYLYHVGGWSGSLGYMDTIRYAAINPDGSLGSWVTASNSLNLGRRLHSVSIYNGRMYVGGGAINTAVFTDTIEYATINSDGSLGTFSFTTNVIPSARQYFGMEIVNGRAFISGGNPVGAASWWDYHANVDSATGDISGGWTEATHMNRAEVSLVAHNGFMYKVGGIISTCNNTINNGVVRTIQYAPIDSSGNFSDWSNGTNLIVPRCGGHAFVHDGYIYLVSGSNPSSGSAVTEIEYAPILQDGSVGSWMIAGETDQPRASNNFGRGADAYNGYMYLVGGNNGGHLNSVVYRKINNGGSASTGSWGTTTGFSTARKNHASVAYNGFIYVLGGCNSSGPCSGSGELLNDVQYAPINSSGNLGAWSTSSNSFSTSRRDHFAFALNGRLYIAGGVTSGGIATDVQCSVIQSSGDLGAWSSCSSTSLPAAGFSPGMTVAGSTLYMIGGEAAQTTSRYAVINTESGNVGSWSTTTSLPEGRYQSFTIAHQGYIYVIGGNSSSGKTRSVFYAPLNANNTIGAWREADRDIGDNISSLSGTSTLASNGYVYILGGENSDGFYNRVKYSYVGRDGGLGEWYSAGRYSAGSAGGAASAALHDGVMYMTGGQESSGGSLISTARFAVIQATPRISKYSKLIDLNNTRKLNSLRFQGTGGGVFTLQYRHACGNSFGPLVAIDNARQGVNYPIGENSRYIWVHITTDDTFTSSNPDLYGSAITDITVNYQSVGLDPDIRMRMGTHFVDGVKQPMSHGAASAGC